jgi:hypothetical protein
VISLGSDIPNILTLFQHFFKTKFKHAKQNDSTVPDRRRLWCFTVVYVIILACVGGKRGKRGAMGGWVRDLKVGQLTLSMGLARAEVRSCVKELPFHLRGLFIL